MENISGFGNHKVLDGHYILLILLMNIPVLMWQQASTEESKHPIIIIGYHLLLWSSVVKILIWIYIIFPQREFTGSWEMVQWLRAPIAPAKDPGCVPHTHIRCLTTIYSSSSRHLRPPSGHCWLPKACGVYVLMQAHIQTHK